MAKEKTTNEDAPEVAEKPVTSERTYFFPDFNGHQISVKASSQEEAQKKAAEIAASKDKKG